MKISVFGFSITIEMLILLGILYLIIVMNTLYSCCNWNGITEGLEVNSPSQTNTMYKSDKMPLTGSTPLTETKTTVTLPEFDLTKPLAEKIRDRREKCILDCYSTYEDIPKI